MRKCSFLKTLFSVCCGTKIFDNILDFSLFRTLWHLFLLTTFCAFILTFSISFELKNESLQGLEFLTKQFGSVVVKSDGVFPANAPQTARDVTYRRAQICYYPSLSSSRQIKIDDELNIFGFLWCPSSIVGWIKLDASRFILYQVLAPKKTSNWFLITSGSDFQNYIENTKIKSTDNLFFRICLPLEKNIPALVFFAPIKQGINNFTDFLNPILYCSLIFAFIKFCFSIITNALFYSFLFALIFNFGKSFVYNLTLSTLLKVVIYAGFPAIIIGTLFSFANIPWLQYQTVYLLALFAYIIPVINRLRIRSKNPF